MSQNTFYGGDDFDLATSDWCPDGQRLSGRVAPARRRHRGQRRRRGRRPGARAQHGGRLAQLLGWFADPARPRHLPLPDPRPGGDADGLYTFVMPTPGRVVAVANIHLPSTPYGPYQVRKGWSSRVTCCALERDLRLKALATVLRGAAELAVARHPGLPDRRLQQPVAPRLDACRCRREGRRAVRRRVAGEPGPGRRGLRRLVPRERAPRPGRGPGLHVVTRRAGDAGRTTSPDRIDWVLHAGPVDDGLQPPGRRARQPSG